MNLSSIFKRRLSHKVLSAVEMIKVGILDRLAERYKPKYGEETADLLAATIVNELFSHKPSDRTLQQFSQVNKEVVQREVSKLRQDEQICRVVTQAVRVEALVLSDRDGNIPESLHSLLKNLENFGILLPGVQTPTPKSFLQTANEFSRMQR